MGEKVSPPSRVRGHKSGRIFLSFFFLLLLILGPFIMPREVLSLVVDWVGGGVEWMIQSRGQ